jgi:hypothetical protein
MSKSRWGGFRSGRKKYKDKWDDLRTPSSATALAPAPETPLDFDYTTAQGIWTLNSTTQFPKRGGGSSYSVGFSTSLDTVSGQNASWSQRTVDISAYAGATVNLVFHYTNGANGFRGDMQLDEINLDGTTYSFESNSQSFQTSGNNESTYAGVSWISVATATTNGRWNRDSGGTPSGDTALSTASDGSFYLYAETTSPANVLGYNFWLRSPQVTLSSTPTLSYHEARSGSDIGTLNVHLNVIS